MPQSSAVIDLAAYRRSRQQVGAPTPSSLPLVMVPVFFFVPVFMVASYY